MLQEREGIHPKPVNKFTKDARTPLVSASHYRHDGVVMMLAKRAAPD